MNKANTRLIKALNCKPVDRPPIWIMRQAGRYLPEYLASRKKIPNFMEFCKNPDLCCEVTMQPLTRFKLDAAILFSDILTIPEALGQQVTLQPNIGPVLEPVVKDEASINNLAEFDLNKLTYVMDAIKAINYELPENTPLLGFSGSPWTLACYMIQGSGSKNFESPKTLMYKRPDLMHKILNKLADAVYLYLAEQIKSGVDAIQIFDSWGGILTHADYLEFSLSYINRIIDALKKNPETRGIPVIIFTKGGGQWLSDQKNSGCNAIGLDWMTEINHARKQVGDNIALQGNLDPLALFSSPEKISKLAKDIISKHGNKPGHIFNLGHGILPKTPIENVAALVETVTTASSSR